jgi:(E)-4-hydroxy-3-methylbut-2-enyl-diphosphate synthase
VVLDSRLLSAAASAVRGKAAEICVSDPAHLENLEPEALGPIRLWSCHPSSPNLVGAYRHLNAWLTAQGLSDLIVLRDSTDGTPEGNMAVAARLGAVLADGLGDLIHLESAAGKRAALNLAYDVLQAAGVRRSKPEYVACPGCGRTLFDLQSTTQRIREKTSHLKNISIAVMGCIVNGPGEMADADFGYVGSGVGTVTLYAGKRIVARQVPEATAPDRLIEVIREGGMWRDP